jgi:predicted dehydrogenase
MTSRRFFIGGVAAAGASAAPRGRLSPNDTIQIGLIGAGSRGRYLLGEVAKCTAENAKVIAVCDVHRPTAATMVPGAVKRATDYHELLAMQELDAVIISAPDFTHSTILTDAVRAGKDAYCEKPFGIDMSEARRAYLTVKQSGRVVQIGTQRRSEPGLIAAAKLIREGAIGKVTRVDMEVNFHQARWRRDHGGIRPEDVDWTSYKMGRFERPFDARRYKEWQLFRESSNGIAGLWMCHYIDLVPWFLDVPYPVSVAAQGGVFLWKDGRETEDVFQALVHYPNDCLARFAMSLTNDSGTRNMWYGDKGAFDGDKLVFQPGNKSVTAEPVESHMANFLRCVRSRQTPRACVEAGFRHAVAGIMAAESLHTGRVVRFDAERLELA